jgi:tRNA threonylcarbamoyladenosine biosynthesis protein TsaB
MIVLGIETSSRTGGVALRDDSGTLSEHVFPQGVRHARNIMEGVDTVLRNASADKRQVDGVAVSQGPGSFTGLRIGVTCAKTLAYVLGWRLVGVPSLHVQVRNVEPREQQVVCPVQDARRGAVYGTLFRWRAGSWQDTSGVLIMEPDGLANRLPQGAFVFGSGVTAYTDIFAAPRFEVGDPSLAQPLAREAAALGHEMFSAGQETDPMELVPRYYRPTAAEENLARREG